VVSLPFIALSLLLDLLNEISHLNSRHSYLSTSPLTLFGVTETLWNLLLLVICAP
jgi:hypothetical protein